MSRPDGFKITFASFAPSIRLLAQVWPAALVALLAVIAQQYSPISGLAELVTWRVIALSAQAWLVHSSLRAAAPNIAIGANAIVQMILVQLLVMASTTGLVWFYVTTGNETITASLGLVAILVSIFGAFALHVAAHDNLNPFHAFLRSFKTLATHGGIVVAFIYIGIATEILKRALPYQTFGSLPQLTIELFLIVWFSLVFVTLRRALASQNASGALPYSHEPSAAFPGPHQPGQQPAQPWAPAQPSAFAVPPPPAQQWNARQRSPGALPTPFPPGQTSAPWAPAPQSPGALPTPFQPGQQPAQPWASAPPQPIQPSNQAPAPQPSSFAVPPQPAQPQNLGPRDAFPAKRPAAGPAPAAPAKTPLRGNNTKPGGWQ